MMNAGFRFTGYLGALGLVLNPLAVSAYELSLGLDTAYIYDSNFYRSQDNEVDAQSVEVAGRIGLSQEAARYRYDASYTGSYEKFKDQDEADSDGHRARIRGSYDINSLTTFHFRDSYRDLQNLRFSAEDIRDGDTGLVANRDRYQRNDLELKLHWLLSRSWELEAAAIHQFVDFERDIDRSDSESYELGARVLRRFSPRHRIGGSIAWIDQDYDGSGFRLDAEANYLVTDISWVFDIGPQVVLTVNGGPAWLETEYDAPQFLTSTEFVGAEQGGEIFRANIASCGLDPATSLGVASFCDFNTPGAEPIPADGLGMLADYPLSVDADMLEDDDSVFFGGAAFSAVYSDWLIDLDVRRQQNATTGDAVAARLDRFRWEVGYMPPESTWSAYLAGSWERREALSDAIRVDYLVTPGPDNAAARLQAFPRPRDADDRRDAVTMLVGIKKQFSRALATTLSVRYRQTERIRSGIESEDDTYFVVAKLSYQFDSIRF